MPLLRKQPFHVTKPPPDLHPDEEVFRCKMTNEIFRSYSDFFDRTIICNSLVWTCSLTGRSGLTYEEAVASERRAERQLCNFPEALQKPLLFLATLTHRTNLVHMNDDVFNFAKDRYFIGETVEVLIAGERTSSLILKVEAPSKFSSSKMNGDVIVIDDDSDEDIDDQREPHPAKELMYIIQPCSGKNKRVMVRAAQISRKKEMFTRDKSGWFFKSRCHFMGGIMCVKESIIQRMNLKEAKFDDFFVGPRPKFPVSEVKKGRVKPSVSSDSAVIHTPRSTSSVINTPRSTSSVINTPRSTSSVIHTPRSTSSSSVNSPVNSKRQTPVGSSKSTPRSTPQAGISPENKEYVKKNERLTKLAKQLEIKRQAEEEKNKRREEKEKERLKKLEEKKRKREELKEWSRSRDDMECDDLKPMPEFKELKTRLGTCLFGDALMVLEYVNAFKAVFDFDQFFPGGFTWSHMESALLDADPQGPLCDLVQMLLCALFNLQEEEAEEEAENMEEAAEELDKSLISSHTGDEEVPGKVDQVSNNELIRSATMYAQFSQLTFGVPLRDILLDQFTLSEILRLHLLSSGAHATQSNARFRYQQRGGYSALDDPGLELRKQDYWLIKKMQSGNIYDFNPAEKLRLLTTVVQQIMTYSSVRDIIEDSSEKLRSKKSELRLIQWREARRIREVQVLSSRREMEKRVKEQENRLKEMARVLQTKQAVENGLEPPVFPPMEPIETPEQKQQLEDQEKEEAQKKAEYSQKEKQLLQEIMDLQRTNAIYPVGRDRSYRRYWIFSSLPAVLVEDPNEEKVDVSRSNLKEEVAASCSADNGVKEDVSENGFLAKEDSNGDHVDVSGSCSGEAKQSDNSSPLKDGLKVSHMDTDSTETESKEKISDSCPIESTMEVESVETTDSVETESKVKVDSSCPTKSKMEVESVETKEGISCENKDTDDLSSVHTELTKSDSPQSKDCIANEPAKVDCALPSQTEDPKWYIIDSKDCLQQLMASLNMRGFRESALLTALQDMQQTVNATVEACPVNTLCQENAGSAKEKDENQSGAPAKQLPESSDNESACYLMEMSLRSGLLDLEERIFVGSLGTMKIKDREAWRQTVMDGGYNPQTTEAPFAQLGQAKKKSKTNAGSNNMTEELCARDLAHALVQIARGVELRFMKPPFDQQHKDPHRRSTYERWEESTLSATSFSHVFLHLAAFENYVKWDRSALNTRCRICRRKRDPEQMLLCDKCDRGHHMYCLTPPIMKIPAGDWFCPNCRPKVAAPAVPKKKRRTFKEIEEEEEDLEECSPVEDSGDEEGEEMEEDEEAMQEEDEEEGEIYNVEFCTECQEGGQLLLCDVCPRSYHLQCTNPPLKKIPKGKWMCQVCVAESRAKKMGKSKTSSSKKGTHKIPNGSSEFSKSNSPASRLGTPRDSPTPNPTCSSKATDSASREVTPRGQGHKGKGTPKTQGQKKGEGTSTDVTPKSWSSGKGKRKSSSKIQHSSDTEIDSGDQDSNGSSSRQGCSQMEMAEDVLRELLNHDKAWPFRKAVDRKLAPDYYDVIANPMDFSTIQSKVRQSAYLSPSQLFDDINLIFSNCFQYNTRSAPVYQAAHVLKKFFQTRLHELELEDSDESSSPPPAKKQRK